MGQNAALLSGRAHVGTSLRAEVSLRVCVFVGIFLSAKGQQVRHNRYDDFGGPRPKMAQNGSENGSEGCSEAPEADWRHSGPSTFWFYPSSDPDQVSKLLDLVFGAPGADFE